MDKIVELNTETGSLILESESKKWIRMFLILSGDKIYIGANDLDNIRKRFNLFLSNDDEMEEAGELEGKNVVWIISNSETHHTIYGAKISKDVKIIFIQDNEAKVIGKINLKKDEIFEWSHLINKF